MKRRGFIGKMAGGAAAGAAGISAAQQEPAVVGPLVKTPPVVMAPRHDGVEVVWAVSRLAKGRVEWKGEDGGSGTAAADAFGMVPQGEEILRVRIGGLKAGGRYQFRAITESADGKEREESAWRKFHTLDPKGEATEFVVWNDTHENAETITKLHAASPGGDFLIWNGDTCNDWHREDRLVPTLLHPAGQDFTDGRPLLLVWGNHDVRGKWAYKLPDMIATPAGRPFYAFRSGPVAVICLHTGEDKPDDHPSFGGRVAFGPLREEQGAWLREVTARPEFRDAPYRVAFCHIPLRWKKERVIAPGEYGNGNYDSYSRSSREVWHDALVAWKAQVIVSGHMHEAAWLPGTAEFPYGQLVGGGPRADSATWIEGKADATSLRFVMKGLDGKVIERIEFKPLAV